MRNICALPVVLSLCLLFAACAGFAAETGCEDLPEFCRSDYLRIEAAFRAGMKGAKGQAEELECLSQRNAALAALTERTYAALLVWLADRGDLLRAMEDDQGLWLKKLEALLADAGNVQAQEEAGGLLLARLRAFGTVMSAPLDLNMKDAEEKLPFE